MKIALALSMGDKGFKKETADIDGMTELEKERAVKSLCRSIYATIMIDLNIGAYKKEDGDPLL